jgi:hypothetical protein
MTLTTLVRSSDPVIANTANLTIRTMASFKSGEISATEYKELMANILDLNNIIRLTSDMNRQNEIANAFNQLKDIAGILVSL